jgi:hypothetical protein
MARTRRTPTVIEPSGEPVPPGLADDLEDMAPDDEPDDLEFLLDASQPGVTWFIERHKTQDEVNANPRGKAIVFVTKLPAPIDLNAFHREYGGGSYRFSRQLDNGRFAGSRRVELDGPPRARVFDPPRQAPQPAPVTNGQASYVGTIDPRDRMMRVLTREIRELRREAQAARSAPVSPLMGMGGLDAMGQIFALAEKIANRQTSQPEPINAVIEAFTKGIDLGTQREPVAAAAGTDWVAVAREAAPIVRDLLGNLATAARARAAAGPGRPAGPAPAATATATGNPSAPPSAPAAEPAADADPLGQLKTARWTTVVDALARAFARQVDPEGFADTLRDVLPDEDLVALRFATVDQVAGELAAGIAGYPALATPDGVLHAPARAYLEAVHTALVSETEPDAE